MGKKPMTRSERWKEGAIVALVLVFLPLLLIVALCFGVFLVLRGLWLRLRVAVAWAPHKKRVLLVHSDSPVWGPYLAEEVIPMIADQAVLLNWSKRSQWPTGFRTPLEVSILNHWLGGEEFNPAAVIFRGFRRPVVIRFWRAFKAFKRGRPEEVEKLRVELFRRLGVDPLA